MEFVYYGGLNSRARELAARIPALLEEMPARVAPADMRMRDAVERTRLVLTGNANWVFEATGMFSKIEISRNAVEVLHSFCYGHVGIYSRVFAGRGNLSGEVDLTTDPELAVPIKALEWVYSESVNESVGDMPDEVPAPSPGAAPETFDEKVFNIAQYAILFHLLHELAHIYVFDGRELSAEERFREELQCDRLAVRWMRGMIPRDDRDLRRIRAGLAFGLAYVAAQSVDRKSHDGITHPKSYDRLVDVLSEFFSRDDDAWAYPFAILAGHMTKQELLPLPAGMEPEGGFPNFYDGVQCLREVIRRSDQKR